MNRVLILLAVLLVAAWLAPELAPHDPERAHLTARFQPPIWLPGGTSEFLLGTDQLGRDVLSRFLHGTRVAILVGLAGGALTLGIGVFLGLLGGYTGGVVDVVINRFGEIFTAVPTLIFAIAVLGTLGAGAVPLVITIGLLNWPGPMRVVRGEILALREEEFVQAALALGARNIRIVLRHVLPSLAGIIAVLFSVHVPAVMLLEASLSFLGFGLSADVLTWGQLLSDGRRFISTAWWLVAVPASGIGLVVFAIVTVGNHLASKR